MLEAFQQCEKVDIAGTVDILGALLSWLQQIEPPMGFYDQLVQDLYGVRCLFEYDTAPDCPEALYSYWKDGEAKLNMIINTLISEKTSIGDPTYLEDLEAFQQSKDIHNLIGDAFSLLSREEHFRSFDEHLIEEMESVYKFFSNLLARGDGPTLEDLYSQWPHGEIKLKLIIDTLLIAHERNFSDDKEASERITVENNVVEEKSVAKSGPGSSSKPNISKPKGKKSKKSRKGGRK